MNIVETVESDKLFKPWFTDLTTWEAWITYLRALFALSGASSGDLATFKELSETPKWPLEPYEESYVVAGRRSGKSSIVSLIAVYMALFKDWTSILSKGEKGHVFVIATNKVQAGIIQGKIISLLDLQPSFRRMIKKVKADEIELNNEIVISVKPASFRSTRGYTIIACILEELAFWRYEEAAIPDVEIVRALRPGLVRGGLMIGISSPYAKSGFLYDQVMKYRGKEGGPLVWLAPTERMNPTFDKAKIAKAFARDPVSAASEYGGQFRADTSNYCDPDIIDGCVAHARHGLAYREGIVYQAFIDASGGRSDSFTLGISHREKEKIVLDCALERRPPFKPESVIEEFSKTIKSYHLHEAVADRYAGELVVSPFKTQGIDIVNSKRTKSELYLELLPLLLNGKVELLDNGRLISQLKSLDRKVRVGGKDLIDNFHGHDDVINAAAGACVLCALEEDVGPDWAGHGASLKPVKAKPEPDGAWVVGSSGGGKRQRGDTRLADGGKKK